MKKTLDKKILDILSYTILAIMATCATIPFILLLSGSFTSDSAIKKYGFGLIPKEISLSAYKLIFENPVVMLNAYKVSITVTIIGTFLVIFISSMTAYVLSRKDYKYRNVIAFYFFFTTLFSGGLIPYYILMVQYLHMKNIPIVAMIITQIFNFFYIIIMRSFMSGIPESISESAKIDGANDFIIFTRLILPLSKPVIATIGLFAGLGYWNDWFSAMLYVNKENSYPLQYFLYKILNSIEFMNSSAAGAGVMRLDLPTESFKLAATIVATGPILLLYPFLQKYFIKGMTIGAVKG